MRCFVTAGPTWDPLDQVRRFTNFSTGRLGGELANALAQGGHDVSLYLSESATWNQPLAAIRLLRFSTTQSLSDALHADATADPVAVFHAAAVSDFTGGGVFRRLTDDRLILIEAGKFSTREGSLLVELVPTPKILPRLRDWFPASRLIGWKYEIDGTPADAVARGADQIAVTRSDACVVNGAAYGVGFAFMPRGQALRHCPDRVSLFAELLALT
ncbi:MAG TPA: phosphopantothenoylcysteine decarboxylase [Verrucomicrobiota bacterium]|nr:DNA/pantothenate metabolism flavoprotein domain protein [Verrucomicrobiales bacterium]HRI14768.1 phosphopantothenoylcysteine decarboxylase [Verrucomicrobiota bacterium]